MARQATRTVTGLLLDAAYGAESREELGRLKADIGHVVEVDRLIELVGKRFPEVAAHPDFQKEASACCDLVVSMLGLEPWEEAWLVTRRGIAELRKVRHAVEGASPEDQRRILRGIGPSIRRPSDLSAALVRAMPDLTPESVQRDPAHQRSDDGAEAPITHGARSSGAHAPEPRTGSRFSAQEEASAPARAPRPRPWRPPWWLLLREWSAERGFRLQRMEVVAGSVTEEYLEGVRSLLLSDEDLALPHWRSGFTKPAEMTNIDRIEVHAHLVHQGLKRVRAPKRSAADVTPSTYTELIKQAFFLGLHDDVVDVALARRFQRTTTLQLRRGMRIKASVGPGRPLDEVLEVHDVVASHARSLGMGFDDSVSRATDVVAVTRWSLKSTAVTKALRYRVPIILIDDFLGAGMRDELEAREISFPAQRAAICGRCGILHAFPARRVHRKDLLCPACR